MSNLFDLFRQIAPKDPPTPRKPVSRMIVGLGNPGDKYTRTRHNAGFLALDHLAAAAGARIDRAKFHGLCGEGELGGEHVLFLKPQTMMNASGCSVQEAAAFYKLAPEQILVLCDDITRDPGYLRLRRRGSHGGHNGLKDIIRMLGTDNFPRLRLGVGEKPHPDYDLAAWVLSDFTAAEMKALTGTFPELTAGVELWLRGQFDGASQICNSHRPEEARQKENGAS